MEILEKQANIESKMQNTDTKEYNLAKDEGFEGSFMDYLLYKEQIWYNLVDKFSSGMRQI